MRSASAILALLLCLSPIGLAATPSVLRADEPEGPAFVQLSLDDPARLALDASTPPDAPPAEFLFADETDEAPMPADIDSLLKRIEELEAAEDERSGAEKKKADDEKKKKEDEAQKALDWTDMSTDKWTVKLGGHVQLEYINWADSSSAIPNTQDYFEFRRLRLVADGTGYGVYDFRLQMTLEPESVGESPIGNVISPDVKDAYFSINEVPLLGRLRIGNFFVPFGLEQVTNDTNNIFLERSIPTQGVFCADREVGLAMYNCTPDQRITWASGVFFDSISEGLKERIDNNQGYRAAGRVTWLPYYDELSNGRYLVHTGLGVMYTEDQNDQVRFRSRPQIHEGPRIIDSGVLAADSFTTGNVELAVVMGRVTLQSEYYLNTTNMLVGQNETFHGGYAHLSYFLTGENRVYERFGQHGAQFGRNVPYSNVFFTPTGCSLGAWEMKARYSHLDLNSVNRGEYNDITLGFNW
ncbi:MAG: hypothetical protein JNG89_13935 [Planctomycetaceae bacterium]|nr:hypothetical protein [Planctomycetaceae bacterium]